MAPARLLEEPETILEAAVAGDLWRSVLSTMLPPFEIQRYEQKQFGLPPSGWRPAFHPVGQGHIQQKKRRGCRGGIRLHPPLTPSTHVLVAPFGSRIDCRKVSRSGQRAGGKEIAQLATSLF